MSDGAGVEASVGEQEDLTGSQTKRKGGGWGGGGMCCQGSGWERLLEVELWSF